MTQCTLHLSGFALSSPLLPSLRPPSFLQREHSSFIQSHRQRTTQPAFSRARWTMERAPSTSLRGKVITITGGTGFIGRHVLHALQRQHCTIILLARSPRKAKTLYPKSAYKNLEVHSYDSTLEDVDTEWLKRIVRRSDVVLNMAGEDISTGKWTDRRKRQLWDSRIVGTRNLANVIGQVGKDDLVFVSMSAVGYYGSSENRSFEESDEAGNDFLAQMAKKWEECAQSVVTSDERRNESARSVILRTGVVLGKDGGALSKMKPAFDLFLGGVPGSGRQKFSWVHIDDVVNVIMKVMTDESYKGIYNVTSPRPVDLREFCSALGESLGKPSWLPVPGFAIKALVGNEAAQLVLAGQEVLPRRLMKEGYEFRYRDVRDALGALNRTSVEVESLW